MTTDHKSTNSGATNSGASGFGPEDFSVFMPPRARRPKSTGRHVLFGGVAAACLLGVGLGLWARPAMNERQAAAPPPADAPAPKATAARRELAIVVNDLAGPIRAPIDVLPAHASAPPQVTPRAPVVVAPETVAPMPPPQGLMRVRDVTPLAPSVKPQPAPRPAAKPRRAPLVVAALPAPKPSVAKAKPPAAEAVRLAKATPAPKPSHKAELARAAEAKASAHRIQLAKTAQAARTAKADRLLLAKAEAKGRAEAQAEAKAQALADARDDARKRARLASIAHAFQRLLPQQTKPAPVEVAQVEHRRPHKTRHDMKVEQASLKTHRPPHPEAPPARAHAVPLVPPPRPSGLMKVSTPRCASRDPGEALVCADPSLGAADRQLTRAYQGARAAGVPDAQLQRQQERWLAARSAAAREAPWAVHDVYLARIAELNGLAKEAHGDGY
jgi:hypothetical protein